MSTNGAVEHPRNDSLPAICSIWAEVLELEHVGPDDDFFSLGGDSFALIEIVAQVEEVVGGAITVVSDGLTPRTMLASALES
jgi:hypothetical protein